MGATPSAYYTDSPPACHLHARSEKKEKASASETYGPG